MRYDAVREECMLERIRVTECRIFDGCRSRLEVAECYRSIEKDELTVKLLPDSLLATAPYAQTCCCS